MPAPTSPRSLFAFSNSTSEVVISWEPPAEMNGNFTHYVVEAEAMEDNPKYRDFCSERKFHFRIPLTKKNRNSFLLLVQD